MFERVSLTSIDVEEVIASHARLAWHTGRDHNKVAAVQSLRQLLRACEAAHLCTSQESSLQSLDHPDTLIAFKSGNLT